MKIMKRQQTFGDIEYEAKKRMTKREIFLNRMDEIVPWKLWTNIVEPYYPKGERGRPPKGIELMLRMYFLQIWFSLSDEMVEDSIYDSQSMRRFLGINFLEENAPDATTLLKFRHLLEEHKLCEKMFKELENILLSKGIMMQEGTIVDATIIAAPSSTKNNKKERVPEMKSTKKGNQWHFGMKAHIGVDTKSGLVHTVETTSANVHDIEMTEKLIHGNEKTLHGDAGYLGVEKREGMPQDIDYQINVRPSSIKKLEESEQQAAKDLQHAKSSVRAFVEHPFHILKDTFGFRKTRYRGISKNLNRLNILFASVNLLMCARRGMALHNLL
jgi:IS5 family transposase